MDGAGGLSWREEGKKADFVFTGLQILCPKIFKKPDILALGNNFPLNKIYRAYLPHIKGVENDGKWYHIGTPEALYNLPANL
jgi:MurNAc alpha-1-phosphate uridylyltransferase